MTPESPFIYVGPTIETVAIRNTVYAECTWMLESAIRIRPYLAGLCIPISQLAEAMKQIQKGEGYFYTLYSRAEREARKIAKGEI